MARTLNYLGLQDATRKCREPSTTPGPWAGSTVHSTNNGVGIQISQARWDKVKDILQWIHDQLSLSSDIEFKQLEKFRGVLVYISRTYPSFTPYLKGIHLTLDSWRPWRKADGWKMSYSEIQAHLQSQNEDSFLEGSSYSANSIKPPARVHPVPQLAFDLQALQRLTTGTAPVRRNIRPESTPVAFYGFADASGCGFGSTLVINNTAYFRHGQWSSDYVEHSSNFRELYNLVSAMEEAHTAGLLSNCELFMFTDNSTAESAYFKGSSTSPLLFDLVLRLQCLQMAGDLFIHVIHVAGTRIQAEGTDGLSRGFFFHGRHGWSGYFNLCAIAP